MIILKFLSIYFILVSITLLGLHIFYNMIYRKYKRTTLVVEFDTLMSVLKTIINTELDAYENDIFTQKGNITNSNFDNYYNDLTKKIIENISDDFLEAVSYYIPKSTVYRIVARSVKKYLTEHINGST